jgi:hypothetical protein
MIGLPRSNTAVTSSWSLLLHDRRVETSRTSQTVLVREEYSSRQQQQQQEVEATSSLFWSVSKHYYPHPTFE